MGLKATIKKAQARAQRRSADKSAADLEPRAPLQEKIEVLQDRPDNVDADLLPYVDQFVASMQTLKPLEEISLLTQEDATQALAMIEKTLTDLQAKLGVAQSLKHLLQSKR